MKKKLWLWFVGLFLLFGTFVITVVMLDENNYKKAVLKAKLESYANVLAASADSFETIGFLPPNIRLTVMDTVGFVSFDSYESADSLSNHLMRPEVKDCLSGTEGYSIRRSETSDKTFFYYAKRYDNLIVRLALPYEVDVRNFFRPNWLVVSLLIILFAVLTMLVIGIVQWNGRKMTIEERGRTKALKHEMTSNISHELKTPVSSVRGYLETIINNPDLDEDRKQLFIERSYLQTIRLSDLIRDIALITKMEEQPEQFKKDVVDVNQLVDLVFDEFSDDFKALDMSGENKVPKDLQVIGNYSLLYALFRNLVENSVRYAGKGSAVVVQYNLRQKHVHFTYYDTGKGVADNELEKIFERFYRVQDEKSHKAEGSGLGLSIVRNAVDFHGGTICASQHQGGGLQFDFDICAE